MSIVVVVNPPATLVLQQETNQLLQINQLGTTQNIVTAGPQGPRGADGTAGTSGDGQYPAVEFAFGDASPAIVLTLTAEHASEITLVQLEIEEGFDGTGASVAIGIASDPDLLVRADQNDPAMEGTIFEVSPRVELPASAQIQLTIVPGTGATQGRGKFVIQATPLA